MHRLSPRSVVRRRLLRAGLAAASLATAVPLANADGYPSRTIRLVVPFGPGGATDVLARTLAEKLHGSAGQAVVVDNKPGASSMIGADTVAKAAPDGHTLLVSGMSTYSVVPALKAKLPYDHRKDLALLGIVAQAPLVLVVPAASPSRTLAEFIARAKDKSGGLGYATFGPGSAPHLAGEMLAQAAGVQLLPVPYRGSAAANVAVIGGEVELAIDTLAATVPNIQAGRLRALAVLEPTRTRALPDVATVSELGLPGATFEGWYGIAAPAGIPAGVRDWLATRLQAALTDETVVARLQAAGLEPAWQGEAAFRAKVDDEIARFSAVAQRAGISID